MIDQDIISKLNQVFNSSPGGFVVVDSGKPKFAVIDYKKYKKMVEKSKVEKKPKQAGKILVTGGAGYIGSHTVRMLIQEGFEVVVYDNLSTGRKEAVGSAKLIEADLADEKMLDKVFAEEKIDAVVHFAASIVVPESVQDPGKYFVNNVVNGVKLLDAMQKYGVDKIVFSSTAAVYGQPDEVPISEDSKCAPENPYGESKLMFEKILWWYAQAYGIDSVTLRYFNAAGAWPEEGLGYRDHNFTHLIPNVLDVACGRNSELVIFGNDYSTADGTGVRDYIHVLDLAEAHIMALEKLDRDSGAFVYNVGTGQGHSVLEVTESAVEITGHMIPMNFGPRRPGDPAKLIADSSKIQNEFTWKPQFNLSDIIESSWEWHKRLTNN